MKDTLLQIIYRFFDFDGSDTQNTEPFYSMRGDGHPRFLLNMIQSDFYECYTFSGALFVTVTHETPIVFTSVFLDLNTQFFVHEKPGERNVPQLHKHDYFELAYVVDGQLELMIENSRHRLLAGDACIINSNVKHRELPTGDHTVIYLGIRPEQLNGLSSLLDEKTATPLNEFFLRNRQHSDEIDYLNFTPLDSFRNSAGYENHRRLFVCLFEELMNRLIGYQQICEVNILRIFAVLQNPATYICSSTRFQDLSGEDLFEQTIRHINDKKRKLSRQELEADLRYNGTYISRVFLKRTGQSLADYNRDICISEAARLLLNSQMSVREIIHHVGYENITVFYDLFRKKYGITPKMYRDMKFQETTEQEERVAGFEPQHKHVSQGAF